MILNHYHKKQGIYHQIFFKLKTKNLIKIHKIENSNFSIKLNLRLISKEFIYKKTNNKIKVNNYHIIFKVILAMPDSEPALLPSTLQNLNQPKTLLALQNQQILGNLNQLEIIDLDFLHLYNNHKFYGFKLSECSINWESCFLDCESRTRTR